MKTFSSFTIFHLLKVSATGAVLALFPSCVTVGSLFRQAESPLPIQTFDSSGGEIATARAFETSDRLYVAGALKDKARFPTSTRVDVQLVDVHGRVIAEEQGNLASPYRHPRMSGSRIRRPTYVESFPLSKARQADKILVRSHRVSHGT